MTASTLDKLQSYGQVFSSYEDMLLMYIQILEKIYLGHTSKPKEQNKCLACKALVS